MIAQVLCLQHIRAGKEVLHLKDLEVNITAKGVAVFFAQLFPPRNMQEYQNKRLTEFAFCK
jgi:hypothetical protein